MAVTGWQVGAIDVRDGRFNISTLDGWDSMPSRRGANIEIPLRHGAVSVPSKFYKQRTLTLNIIVLPNDASGAVTHTNGARAHIRENLDVLLGALYSDSLISVQRVEPAYPGAGTVTWEALCEVLDVIPVRSGAGLTRLMAVRFKIPRPFWRILPEVTGGGTPSVSNIGNAPVDDMVVTFTGGTNPKLTNTTTGEFLMITDAMANPVVVDVGERTVKQLGAPVDAVLSHAPGRWLEFVPGTNSLSLTGGGTVSIDFYSKTF
jgi:hypothetical protein